MSELKKVFIRYLKAMYTKLKSRMTLTIEKKKQNSSFQSFGKFTRIKSAQYFSTIAKIHEVTTLVLLESPGKQKF